MRLVLLAALVVGVALVVTRKGDAPGMPCDKVFEYTGDHPYMELDRVERTDCATGERVLRLVHRWATPNTDDERRSAQQMADLGASRHRLNAGFRCEASAVPDTDVTYRIDCTRDDQVVHGHAGVGGGF